MLWRLPREDGLFTRKLIFGSSNSNFYIFFSVLVNLGARSLSLHVWLLFPYSYDLLSSKKRELLRSATLTSFPQKLLFPKDLLCLSHSPFFFSSSSCLIYYFNLLIYSFICCFSISPSFSLDIISPIAILNILLSSSHSLSRRALTSIFLLLCFFSI